MKSFLSKTALFLLFTYGCRFSGNKDKFIYYKVENLDGVRIDDNTLPCGDTLPLRLTPNDFSLFNKQLINVLSLNKGDYLIFNELVLNTYGANGVYYLNGFDTVYILKPMDSVRITIKLL